MRRPSRFYSLSRPRLRQSWNKYNLYNFIRQIGREYMLRNNRTFFQQKWAAKAKTRAYHGEHISEKKWIRMFSSRLLAAVDMPPQYLAANDGSEQATGRGSGLTTANMTAESYSIVPQSTIDASKRKATTDLTSDLLLESMSNMTPYMQMTFAPLERRLDTAVFRALFASSVRQARQFVIHGAVKVNGLKMIYPAYQLNPGDMFQVDPEKVMYATGLQKKANGNLRLRENLAARKKKAESLYQRTLHRTAETKTTQAADGDEGAPDGEEATSKEEDAAPAKETQAANGNGSASPGIETLSAEERWKLNNKSLKFLLKDVKEILQNSRHDLTAREKKQLRLFRADCKRFLSQGKDGLGSAQELMTALQQQMKSHELMRKSFEKLGLQQDGEAAVEEQKGQTQEHNKQRETDKALQGLSEKQKEKAMRIMGASQLSREEMRRLGKLLKYDEENPMDDSKPYATPWRPRPFMAAFAFIPRYLEVNHNICAAVYLRHPLARKGMAEVPTPFSFLTSQLAHNWYLERG